MRAIVGAARECQGCPLLASPLRNRRNLAVPDLQTVSKNARFTAGVLVGDLRDATRGRLRPAPVQLNPQQQEILKRVRRDGYAVVPGYWSRERAFEVRDKLLEHIGDENKDFDNG